VHSDVHVPLLHEHPAVGHLQGVLAHQPWDVVACALVPLELELGVKQAEEVGVTLEFA